jgi:hypothetical protein
LFIAVGIITDVPVGEGGGDGERTLLHVLDILHPGAVPGDIDHVDGVKPADPVELGDVEPVADFAPDEGIHRHGVIGNADQRAVLRADAVNEIRRLH